VGTPPNFLFWALAGWPAWPAIREIATAYNWTAELIYAFAIIISSIYLVVVFIYCAASLDDGVFEG
jgi:hypothetical protein